MLVSSAGSRIAFWHANSLAVEVSPIYDNSGETTVLAAAEVALALIGLMVKKPVA